MSEQHLSIIETLASNIQEQVEAIRKGPTIPSAYLDEACKRIEYLENDLVAARQEIERCRGMMAPVPIIFRRDDNIDELIADINPLHAELIRARLAVARKAKTDKNWGNT
jgi:hypothetical protein